MREGDLEKLAMAWFQDIGYQTAWGPDIAPGGDSQERTSLQEVVLWKRFEESLGRINPTAPHGVLVEAVRRFRRRLQEEPNATRCNRVFQEMLTEGIRIEHREGGKSKTIPVRIVARDDLDLNDWFAVNQIEVWHDRNHRIPDIVEDTIIVDEHPGIRISCLLYSPVYTS